ncbi:NAD(P)/FAD-dependent oxidoreductase [Nodosilinea sp. LEGE 07088]|uniref:NAD(P)/FAD-dependent oxidoreductase n=1 Tax=Nodosilinea sp. LEGE 07088 TaxID=2777968 RepID=UPI00187F4266|nr:NAD(P)/FAD-dependent oxidoreductase [Nodosilinea sp. LEGE 07088]MBE9136509.1 NAD(P)/FAD-dependent oxidoreductase [Nodosilinea sp. LEGE 07088]
MADAPQSICILGGGFGGLYTALRLSNLPWEGTPPTITLVDCSDRFLFLPLLYELVTDELQTWEIAPPYAELLAGTPVQFRQGAVAGIDLDQHRVSLSDGTLLTYDRLVLALGGTTPMDMAPGVAEHALAFRTLDDAYQLKERLRLRSASDADKIRVAVVGGGYSGVELACKVAEHLGDRGRVRLIERTDTILRTSPEYNREVAQKALSDLGVWVDLETAVDSVTADTISLTYREQTDILPVELVLWTVGTKVNEVVANLPLKHNDRQQIVVQPTLESVDRPGVYALGDVADCRDAEGQQVPATAQVALQQADFVGWNIWASLSVGEASGAKHRPQMPFRYQHLGEMMTLGTSRATLTGLGVQLDGELAHMARRLIYLYRLPTFDHQVRVGINWMTKPLRDLLSA